MKTRLTIEIDSRLKARAKAKAYGEERTVKQVVAELLQKWLTSDEENNT